MKENYPCPDNRLREEKNYHHLVLFSCCYHSVPRPFVVFKGKTMRPLKNVTIPDGVVATTQKKAWMDEARMIE